MDSPISNHKPPHQHRDPGWTLTLIGTAVGAGILYLPIEAGRSGIWPLLPLIVLVGPVIFLAHRGLARFCLSSSQAEADITDTVSEHFGSRTGLLITLAYFIAIYPILMIYGIGITNTVTSFLQYQLGVPSPPRSLLSLILVGALVGMMACSQSLILKLTELFVYPLIVILFGVSIYLIPQWDFHHFEAIPTPVSLGKTLLLAIPVMVFSFNHSPAISSFARTYRLTYGSEAEARASRTLLHTSLILISFVMFFVFSCIMALTPEQLKNAYQSNLPILSFFAQISHNPIFAWLAQLVALLAIISSFFGTYMGTREGLNGLLNRLTHRLREAGTINSDKPISHQAINRLSMGFIFITVWLVAYLNLSVVQVIELIVAPVIAAILFIMPAWAPKYVPALKHYDQPINRFTLVMGSITIVGFMASHLF